MKHLVNVARVVVGVLFIFSGLVKANDPLGLSYKMHEFFEVWKVTGFESWTLPFSILMNAFEIIAGFALLLGWRISLFSWLLFLLILFFTFLTGYTYVTGKPTNCGCFGDCLPISSKTSFLKDVVLTILIGFILFQQNRIKPVFSRRVNNILMLLVTIFSFGLQWYALKYLPPVDCLPFKKGNNITEKMKAPIGSLPDSFAIRFVYKKAGKDYEFSSSDLPVDIGTYDYVSRTDKLIRKGNAEPPIKGFVLAGKGETSDLNLTDVVLEQPYALLLFCEDFTIPFSKWKNEFSQLYQLAGKKNIPVYVVTGRPAEAGEIFSKTAFPDVSVLSCDVTAIRTAARTNPCFFLLQKGTVIDKQSYHRADLLIHHLETIPPLTKIINTEISADTTSH